LNILENYSLKDLNSFGIDLRTKFFTAVKDVEDLQEIIKSDIYKINKSLILGGGSNILFTQNFPGLILYNQFLGIEIIEKTKDYSIISVAGGENWHQLVKYTIAQNLGGLENLSLIPGSVGAAPIQNIGAYGVELKEVVEYVFALDVATGEERKFTNAECLFGYRDSVFKNELKDKYFITKVHFKLSKNHQLNITYGAIRSLLEEKNISHPTIKDVSNIVIHIRQSKLPDPAKTGNVGSFFKNPIIDKIDYEGLKLSFTDMPAYINGEEVKIPAAWLIEQCGWKGKRFNNIGVHDKQPLVLLNYGHGTGEEILALAMKIKDSVALKFGIELELEPRIL